ncbi:MAG: PAS domain S-box protein, partial [Ectothiorhodospiraceae bacterium]|nr:PAS domain S-box protein [Ectothiorhodospiraceae bacterium]
ALSAAGRAAATEAEVAARTNELREREQDLDITLRSIGDAVLATDPQGRVTRMNPIAEHLTGWSLDEARGRVVDEVLHIINEQTRERALMPVEQVLRTGEMQGLANHTLLIARDGSERAIADSAAPIRTVDGHLRGVVLVFRDVTRERAAEAQFSRFFEMSLDMLCIASADGYFKRVNQTFSRTLGWSVDEMLARPILDFVHPDDREATRHEIDRQVTAGESVMHFENRYRYKYGGWRVLSWRSIPQDGGLMFATARDVTQRNKAEHEIHRLNADLERQVQERTRALEDLNNKEQEIRAVVDNLLDCVITIDAQGIVQSANPMLTKIFGYAPDEIVGQNVSMLMPEPHRGQHDGYLARYLETGEVHVIGVGREVEGRHRSGRLIPLELSVNEYEMRGQRMFIGTLRDIHERKRLIADLTRARLEAEQANRAKSAFLATMSHEIRTPMNGVIGMVDVLAHSRLSEYQADLVHTIRESASTLLSLIDDILDFSKIEAGKLEIEHVPVSVADLVEGLCNSMVTVAARRGVDLFLFVSPAIPERVLSDDVRLRQMLYNLIGNAIKFSSGRTGKRGRVSVRAEVAQTDPLQLSFAIADNGIGMTPATVDQLFTPFTQAEVSTTRRYGGTGLGLTICKRLVDMMQGGIAVASEPGEGSTFTVTLPFDVPAEQPVRELPDLGGIDCILVENRELDVGGLRIYLEHAGAKVRQVSGEDAIGPLAAQMSGPVVAIRFVAQERTGQERTAQEAIDFPLPNLGYLLISRGRRRRARVQAPGVVSLDGDALRRQALLRAVAVAAGRASPEVFHDDAREALPGEDLTPPSITDARAKGRLILVAEDDEINQKVILR